MKEVVEIVTKAMTEADEPFIDRKALVETVGASIETLMDKYFDILPFERTLIDDTVRVIIPSTRPTRGLRHVPTVEPSKQEQRGDYTNRICSTLNEWAKRSPFVVEGRSFASARLGIGVAILEKNVRGHAIPARMQDDSDLLALLERLRMMSSRQLNTFELVRGIKVFEQNRLYIVKPIGRRFWTETAALNDADEIAGSILMQNSKGMA